LGFALLGQDVVVFISSKMATVVRVDVFQISHQRQSLFVRQNTMTAEFTNEDFKELNLVIDQSEDYFAKLRQAHIDLCKEVSPSYLAFSYLTLCAATLEYSLNSIYHDFCLQSFHSPKIFAEAFLSMNFKSKLFLSPIIVTKHQYQFDLNHPTIKSLEQLIGRRNKMLHNKSYVITIDTEKEKDENNMIYFQVKDHIQSLDRNECVTYGNALGKLKSDFLDPYREKKIIATDLIIKF
jgi:hypothetical protein